jgi:hypothetical protein
MTRRRPQTRGPWRPSAVTAGVTIAAAVAMAGCSGDGQAGTAQSAPPAPQSSPSVSPTAPTDVKTEVLDQYRAFWAHLTPASLAGEERRREILAPFTADPELKSLISGIAKDRARGRVFYGQPVVRPRVTQLSESQGVAVVRDCQDASHTGDKDVRTGRRLTKGSPRTLVVATLHRLRSAWRVVFVSFPSSSC